MPFFHLNMCCLLTWLSPFSDSSYRHENDCITQHFILFPLFSFFYSLSYFFVLLFVSLLSSALKSVPFTARSAKRSSRLFCDSVFSDEVTSLNSRWCQEQRLKNRLYELVMNLTGGAVTVLIKLSTKIWPSNVSCSAALTDLMLPLKPH